MSSQTTDPSFIDINLATSLDFQIHLSDYIDLVTELVDEVALNINFWHTDAHSDPTTSKIEFYKQLNAGNVNLKSSKDGVIKRDVTDKQLINKNYRDQLPDQLKIRTSSGNKYGEPKLIGEDQVEVQSITTTRKWTGDPDIQSVGKWEVETKTVDSKHQVTPLLDIQKSPPEVSSAFGMKDMSAWFKLWWMDKFTTSHDVVKQDLIEILGDENEYFVKFSESVGQLKNISDTFDTSTLPVWDTEVQAYGSTYSIPSTIAGVAKYCTRGEAAAFNDQLSKHTNKVFRNNMVNMMEDPSRDELVTGVMPSFSSDSHGNNLVNDQLHFSRMYQQVEVVDAAIREHLKGLYDVLMLLSDRENYMVVNKPKQIMMKVENFTLAVDLFKNRIKSYELTDDDITISRYGKPAGYNNTGSNDSKLAI
jgi:hypothetical protein